jgi:hypothetical protein
MHPSNHMSMSEVTKSALFRVKTHQLLFDTYPLIARALAGSTLRQKRRGLVKSNSIKCSLGSNGRLDGLSCLPNFHLRLIMLERGFSLVCSDCELPSLDKSSVILEKSVELCSIKAFPVREKKFLTLDLPLAHKVQAELCDSKGRSCLVALAWNSKKPPRRTDTRGMSCWRRNKASGIVSSSEPTKTQ